MVFMAQQNSTHVGSMLCKYEHEKAICILSPQQTAHAEANAKTGSATVMCKKLSVTVKHEFDSLHEQNLKNICTEKNHNE